MVLLMPWLQDKLARSNWLPAVSVPVCGLSVHCSALALMAGLSPTLSQLIGQRRRAFVGEVFRQGIWLGLFTGLFALSVVLIIRFYIHVIPLEPELTPLIKDYLMGAAWSLPFFALVMVARNVCEATGPDSARTCGNCHGLGR